MTPSSEEDDGRTYHPCLFRLGGGEHYILWHDENLGGVHIDGEGNTPAFSTIDRLLEYAALHGLQPVADETPTLHDLEWVERFVDEMKSPLEDCRKLLIAWNLFGDVARSTPSAGAAFQQRDRVMNAIYDKVFRGNNLPAITRTGESYVPVWSPDELRSIKALMKSGIALFHSTVTFSNL